MLTDAATPRHASTAITRAMGNAGLPPELTSAIAACGDGVGVGAVPLIDGAGAAVTLGVVGAGCVMRAGAVAPGIEVGRALADCITGACVGLAVGRAVGRGVADGDGGGVAEVVTVMVPCIAA
jgi:hypothetical protein